MSHVPCVPKGDPPGTRQTAEGRSVPWNLGTGLGQMGRYPCHTRKRTVILKAFISQEKLGLEKRKKVHKMNPFTR